MMNAKFSLPEPVNDPILKYAPGSPEKAELKTMLREIASQTYEVPLIIGGQEIKTGNTGKMVMPHDHQHILGHFHKAGAKEVEMAIEASQDAWTDWSSMHWVDRAIIFRKAAELLSGPWRAKLNAATMLNQGKNAYQAEIDAACELIDFWNFNTKYMEKIYERQPSSPKGFINRMEHRALEGFVFAVTPFNFTAIAGNLPTAPAMMGNTVLWKPASSAVLSAYFTMQLFKEAGLPDGVINFIPGNGSQVGPNVLKSPHLAGIHFTGSTAVFQNMWKTVGENIQNYKTYPRIVGETGGKDFVFVHKTAQVDAVVTALIRGSFEFQGQKCSAASRAYIPDNLWPEIKEKMVAEIKTIKVGDPRDFRTYVNAVIDKPAFDSIVSYLEYTKTAQDAEFLAGGTYDDSKGYFIDPTVIVTTDPHYKTMEEEIFGPVLTIYVYPAEDFEKTLKICDSTSIYGLTGSILAQDRDAINLATKNLQHAAGNFYINDKPTAAVVGQQPFGGSRASGTNDKAGDITNILRWTTPRSLKETLISPTNYRYPFLEEE